MARFTKTQFIGMSICTTASNLTSIEDVSVDGYYAGLLDDHRDLAARVAAIKNFIEESYRTGKVDTSDSTLKVFVIPEFFMRGVLGAYYNTWVYPMEGILLQEMRKALNELISKGLRINDTCLFVLGTILSTCSPIFPNDEPTKSLYNTGDNLLDVYYRLHSKALSSNDANVGTENNVSLGDYLKAIDEAENLPNENMLCSSGASEVSFNAPDNAYIDLLMKTLNYCDTQADVEVTNRCLIMTGSANPLGEESSDLVIKQPYGAYVVQKQFKSKEDFILNNKDNNKLTNAPKYIQTIVKYPDVGNANGDKKKYDEDGLALFEYGGVKIGVDICLDHSRQRLVKHLYNNPNDRTDIQIITACGMSVRPNAVISRKGGYVFNCDGEYTLNDKTAGYDGIFSHTTLRRIDESIVITDKVVSKNAQLANALAPTIKRCNLAPVPEKEKLFRFFEYDVHVYPEVPL